LRGRIFPLKIGAASGILIASDKTSGKEIPMNKQDKTLPMAANDNDLFNVVEAAAFLRLKRSTLDHYRCEGRGPIYRKHGTRVFYTRASLLAWSEAQMFSSTSSRVQRTK
tara:strand:- start:2945 stop:3274 length:330 start_codon:yes stop_codon:yes gene_type:complete